MSERCIKCGPVSPNDTYVAIGNIKRHRHPCDGQILEQEPQSSEPQQARERIAELENIMREIGGENPCFCQLKIGHPLYKEHSTTCQKARKLLAEGENFGAPSGFDAPENYPADLDEQKEYSI